MRQTLFLQEDLPAVHPVETGDDVEERRLPGPVGSDDGLQTPPPHGEGDLVERRDPAEPQRDPIPPEKGLLARRGAH